MMSSALPNFDPFDIHSDGAIKRRCCITDKKRQRALLLYYHSGESINAFHSPLRQLSATCEFGDVDKEIKSQIILSCSTQRLRRKALRDTTMTLETLLNEARTLEISETQAKDIESSGNAANAVLPTPSQARENCFNCGRLEAVGLSRAKSQVQRLS